MKRKLVALTLISLIVSSHSCAMEGGEEKEEKIKQAVSDWSTGGEEKTSKKKSKSHIIRRKKSGEGRSQSYIQPRERRFSNSGLGDNLTSSADSIPRFDRGEKKRTFSLSKSLKVGSSPVNTRKEKPRERSKSSTELDLDLRGLLLAPKKDKKPFFTPTSPRKTLLKELEEEELADEERYKQKLEKKIREDLSKKNVSDIILEQLVKNELERQLKSKGNINKKNKKPTVAHIAITANARIRRNNYSDTRKKGSWDSMGSFSAKELMGMHAEDYFDADTTEGSTESPRTDENSSPRTEDGDDPFINSDNEKEGNNNNNGGNNNNNSGGDNSDKVKE